MTVEPIVNNQQCPLLPSVWSWLIRTGFVPAAVGSHVSTPITTETAPTLEGAHGILTNGLDADAMLTIVGRCTVDYSGRTESTLGVGDRLVVLKPDGTLLVHQSTQRDPVNWQPPGCHHTVDLEESETPEDATVVD